MDILPTGLCDLLRRIEMDNTISSWRIQGGYDLVLTVRFQSKVDTSMAEPRHATINNMDTFYRSKPPSSRIRDVNRQNNFFAQQNSFTGISDSGFASTPMNKEKNITPMSKQNGEYVTVQNAVFSSGVEKHNVPAASVDTNGAADIAISGNLNHNDLEMGGQPHTTSRMLLSPTPETTATQTDSVNHEEQYVQTMESDIMVKSKKNRKVQTVPAEQDHMSTQTIKVKHKHEPSQTAFLTRNVLCNTEPVEQIDSAICTESCKTQNRHIQTFLQSKCKGTQYKHQNYQENPPTPVPPPEPMNEENPAAAADMQEPHDENSAKLDFILQKLKLIDKLEETAITCKEIERKTASFRDRIT